MTQCASTIYWTTTGSNGTETRTGRVRIVCELQEGHDDLHRCGLVQWPDQAEPAAPAGWTQTYESDGYVHVRPDNDLIAHTDQDCVCGPTPERVPNPNGPEGWMYTHHSLDGRENQEPAT